MFMVGIAETVLHLPFERRLEDGREDAFDDILDFLCVLGLVGFHDLLGDIACGSGNHFAFCHVGINPPMGCPERARTVSTNLAFTQTIIHSPRGVRNRERSEAQATMVNFDEEE